MRRNALRKPARTPKSKGTKDTIAERPFADTATYIVLAVLAVIAVAMVLKSTSTYGAGMSPDAVSYTSAAKHLFESKGYIDYNGSLYVQWPPLFPTVLALVGLAGIEPHSGGRLVNSISFGLIVFCSGVLFAQTIKSRLLVILGAVAVLLSFVMLYLSVYVWSEPLFILLTILFILNIARFLKNNRTSSLILAGVCAALACLQRYVGVTIIVTGGVFILLFMRKSSWLDRLKYCMCFGTISCTPLGLWVLRNKLTAAGFGSYGPGRMAPDVLQKITQILESITPWFIANKIPLASRLVIIGLFICLLVAAVVFRRYKHGKEQFGNTMLPKAVFTFLLIFSSFVAMAAVLLNAKGIERHFSPIYVFVIFLMLIGLEAACNLLSSVLKNKWAGHLVIIGLCSLWLVFYPYPIVKQRISRYERYGIPGMNSAFWHRSPLISWLKGHPLKGQVFSNEAKTMYFWLGLPAKASLLRNADIAKFRQLLSSGQKNYIVWSYKNRRASLYNLEELNSMFKLKLVKRLRDGIILTIE